MTVICYKCEGNFVKGKGGRGGDTKARFSSSTRARIKEKFTAEIACTHACMHGRLIQWCTFRGPTPLLILRRKPHLYSLRQRVAAYGIAVQTCKYFVANHRPVTMQSYKYSALLPHGISMQTCRYLCIVRASTSENVFTRNVVSIGLLTIYAFSIFITLICVMLTCNINVTKIRIILTFVRGKLYQFPTRCTNCTIDRIRCLDN